MNNNEQQIRQFLVENFLPDVAPGDIESDFDLLENGVVDSLGLLTLIGWVEDNFDLAVSDEDLSPEKFDSITAITSYVDRQQKAKPATTSVRA